MEKDYIPAALQELEQMVGQFQRRAMQHFMQFAQGEMFALHYLYMKKEAIQPTELSKASGSSSARIAKLLATLEKKGLVVRAVNPNDRRRMLVTLTERGVARAKELLQQHYSQMEMVLSELGEADTRDFLRTTRRFLEIADRCKGSDWCKGAQ
ncbi:MAG: winged helix DNA-binding protein [Clostridiales Family XIII bacterium]|jgi:DNA-binding MarR family transcriptional regulator|nr:winged helix DNA-binding protein [Clostridiales Family XIII bacterium]